MAEQPIHLLLVDDHRHIHQAVEIILGEAEDITLVGQASNGRDALLLCKQLRPHIILMDVVMPIMDGAEATKEILTHYPETKILVLSSYQDHESVHTMMHNGAIGYITKNALTHELIPTIRTAFNGNMVLSPEIAEKLLNQPILEKIERFHLTDRELEVLIAMASGRTMKEIAQDLFISASTVKFHINNIQSKLGAKTRSEALIIAAKNNLV
ncbi:MAG: response regulator transcription factor [Anaerolineales bacterium]|nr:response regulator transcription factor [Anaerolineales bacterium]